LDTWGALQVRAASCGIVQIRQSGLKGHCSTGDIKIRNHQKPSDVRERVHKIAKKSFSAADDGVEVGFTDLGPEAGEK
jgi:hypothetical protein